MASRSSSEGRRQFGDFQTPSSLAASLCARLEGSGLDPTLILEPTCGKGSMLLAAASVFPGARLIGIELSSAHAAEARRAAIEAGLEDRLEVIEADFFGVDLERLLSRTEGEILVIGNPPWVTSAEMSRIGGSNLPIKSNFKNLNGLDAVTGASNFDISEWVILALLAALQGRPATVAMICKRAVARRVLELAAHRGLAMRALGLWEVDARRNFDAAVDACFFAFRTDLRPTGTYRCPILDLNGDAVGAFGVVDGLLVSNIADFEKWKHLIGDCGLIWRSGIKHDCAKVMTLIRGAPGTYRNGFGESVELEDEYLYPLIRGTDLRHGRVSDTDRRVLVTQRRVGAPTAEIEERAPNTWSYLQRHRARLRNRASTIYRGKPQFSIFGVGHYSFAPWKIATSGLSKAIRFCFVERIAESATMLDDTSYFLGFDDERLARTVRELLDTSASRELLTSMIFWDAKRPLTKGVLSKAHLGRLAEWARMTHALPQCDDADLRAVEALVDAARMKG